MNDIIRITGIEVMARHGVTEEERKVPQPFLIDIAVEEDTSLAAINDDLVGTFWYADLVNDVVDELNSEPVRLRDTLAVRIAERFIERGAFWAEVTIRTPHFPSPVPVADATITVTRRHPIFDDELGVRPAILRILSDGEDGGEIVNRAVEELEKLNVYITAVSEPFTSQVSVGSGKTTRTMRVASMSPMQLEKELQHIEVRLGRRSSSRLLGLRADMTIMVFGSLKCYHPRLALPNPMLSADKTFLQAWLSINPNARLDGVEVVTMLEN